MAARHALALVDVEDLHADDQAALGAERGFDNVGSADLEGDDESEIALDRHEIEAFQLRLGAARARLWRRDAIEDNFERSERGFGVERLDGARMQFAKPADHILRPELQARRTAGMQEGRAAGNDLNGAWGNSEGGEQRQRVAFGVEDAAAARPMPARALRLGRAASQRGGGDALIVLAIAEENLPDLEQADIA